MQDWYLYIIENNLGHLYTGISTDIERRFQEHCADGKKCAKALRGKGPLKLRYCALLSSQRTALQAERWVKKQSRPFKDQLIAGITELAFEHRLQPESVFAAQQPA